MRDLTNQSIRLQVLLERVKAGEDKRIDAFLQDEATLLRQELASANLSVGQRKRIDALLEGVREALSALHARHGAAFRERMDELAATVAETEAKSIAAALDGFAIATPSAQVIRTAVSTAPLSVRGAGGGMLLEAFVAKWGEADVERVVGVIRRGYFEGRTTDEVVRDLIGTRAANYADGELAVSRRHARTVAHTAIQHLANTARAETFKANSGLLKGYRWISTLDSKTSEICQSLDGRVFELGEGPVPPAHPNCRSTVVPVTKSFCELGIDIDEPPEGTRASVDGQVSASLTYFEWLKTQPTSFVEEVLGETRAALFLKGGISPDEFARLQLGRNFQPLTLAELRQKAPTVFARAGI